MLVRAFGYKKWADERTLRAIENINQALLPDSYTFVLQQLNHMVIVEELFKSRLINTPAPYSDTNTKIVPEFNELTNRLRQSGNWYNDYVHRLRNQEKAISFIFADGKPGMMTIEEILFHIINHGSYHRGNIAYALDLASVPHPSDGYGIYIHEKEPQRREAL